ncbi:DUF5719 family protein [Streptomyces odontomachi]|uniref:DUF5719 family protein n=1 Tax=Streptomyces odontomachi TaxID=2944940 RepID=UPI00210A4AC0|nr:DUF5719 family protein [Streptomyces sp. ODS25]
MNRTTMTLIAAVTALLAVTGVATLTAPDGSADTGGSAERRPVERSSLLCPVPSTVSDLADTTYTSFTPSTQGTGAAAPGSAELHAAQTASDTGSSDDAGQKGGDDDTADKDKDKDKDTGKGKDKADKGKQKEDGTDGKLVLSVKKPGKPTGADASGSDSPALIGSADGSLAPGWTVQQTTQIAAGEGRGLLGVNCSAPDTDFWFPGASTADSRSDYIHLTNPDDSAAVVDLDLYGKNGAIKSDVAEGIQVRPHQSLPVLLSTLTDRPETNLTVHVTARTGRVAAQFQGSDEEQGSDWMSAAAAPAGSLVLPGIPKDAKAVRLVAFAPGQEDADLNVKLATPTGSITPAGHETLHVKSGMTAAVDLGAVTRGEAGSLILTPSQESGGSVPVVAALRVVRGKEGAQESAFIPATPAVGQRATAADNRSKDSTFSLVAPGKSVRVRLTSSAGEDGGSPVSKTYTVKGGTTLSVRPPVPGKLKGTYAVTVERLSGGSVYAARMLERPENGIPMFTIQTVPDDRSTVRVPRANQDLSVLGQ